MRPRHLIESDPAGFFEPGIAGFRDELVGLRSILDIPPDLDAVEYLSREENFMLSPETTGEKQPFVPYGYQRGMLARMSDPRVKELYIPKATRTGVTQIATADASYKMAHKRRTVMLVQPTELKAQKYANDYITPAFRDAPALAKILRHPKKGQRQDTWDNRLYSNGSRLILGWAASDSTFRGETASDLYGDEVDDDGWSPTGVKSQGDKFKLFKDRGKTRRGSRLILWSSPLRRKTSRIWPRWEESNKEYYFVPCPHCQHMQRLRWGGKDADYGIKPSYDADGRLSTVHYVCEQNGCLIADDPDTRAWMDENGEWRETAVSKRKGVFGMHISALYSQAPGVTWTVLWEEWTEAQGKPEALQHFINSSLGEPFDDVVLAEGKDPAGYANSGHVVPFRAPVPAWAKRITQGGDVQRGNDNPDDKDWKPPRVEVQTVAWGPGEEFAVIGYDIIPATRLFDEEHCADIDAVLFRELRTEDGRRLRSTMSAFDCSYLMDDVLQFCDGPTRRHVCVPVAGENETGVKLAPIITSILSVHAKSGRRFMTVGTRTAKNTLWRRLHQDTPGPGYPWFPESLRDALPEGYDYFRGLFAERHTQDRQGVERWERITKSNTGEAWDTLVYALVALRVACDRWPQNVGRQILDRSLRTEWEPYDGEDRSHMAEVLLQRQLAAGNALADAEEGSIRSVPERRTYAPPPVPQVQGFRRGPRVSRSSVLG